MYRPFNKNPIGLLSVSSFLGLAIIIFFYKIGNINLLVCIIVSISLLILGIISALMAKSGDENPTLNALFKIIVIVFSVIFGLFVIGAVMLGASGG